MSARSVRKQPETPPSSDVEETPNLPPSPPLSPPKRTSHPTSERLLRTLRVIRAGRSTTASESNDWRVFALSRADFTDFQRRLRHDEPLHAWYLDKVRHDFDGRRYTLRMPSAVHERFIASVEDAIVARIAGLAEARGQREDGKEVATELTKIYKGRSTTLELHAPQLESSSQDTTTTSSGDGEETILRRSPDSTFYHPSQPHLPCLVVEVSYSQQRKDLPRLAESYVVDSRHVIRCVLGLDISYPKVKGKKMDQHATCSVWRPGVETDDAGEKVGTCETHVDHVSFRDADGVARDGALTLNLSDILPPTTLSQLESSLPPSSTTEITIPFADLTTFLTAAETKLPSTSASFASTTGSTAPKRFRKRKRTPREELSDSREAEYARQEAKVARRESDEDAPWYVVSRRSGKDGSDQVDPVERRRSLRRRRSGRSVDGASGS